MTCRIASGNDLRLGEMGAEKNAVFRKKNWLLFGSVKKWLGYLTYIYM
jgi:hypothetical protein